jgi:multiple sugar transport system substrate-binding protein
MKYLFLGSFAAMSLLSVVAWLWRPAVTDDGKIDLVWVSDDNPVRREQIELFNRLYPTYRLRLDPGQGTWEKVIVQCLAGVGPDLFDCYNGFQLMAYVRSGAALDVTEAWAERGMKLDEVWPCLTPLFADGDRIYGHPDNTHAPAVWYNKALFDAAGIPYPAPDWTWDDCIEIARKLTVRDARDRPVQFGLMMARLEWPAVFLAQWGGRMYTPEGTRCILDSPEGVAGLQFAMDLIHKYRVMPNWTEELAMATAGGWGMGPISMFGAGRGAMAIGGRWWLCMLRNKDYKGLRLGAVTLPKGPYDRVFGGGRSTLVNANSKHIEGALCFLEYMHGEYWNQLINHQADALGPVIKYHYGEYEAEFLHNPEHPEEDYNATWRTALEKAEITEVSPYVNGQAVDRVMLQETDKAWANLKSARETLTDVTGKVNREIVEVLRRDPVLRSRYYQDLARGARPAWDREEDAP